MHEEEKFFELAGKTFREGDELSLDGSTGNIYDRIIKTVPVDPNSGYFGRIMKLADKYKALGVRTNADTPEDAQRAARQTGVAAGNLVGLEHDDIQASISSFDGAAATSTAQTDDDDIRLFIPLCHSFPFSSFA